MYIFQFVSRRSAIEMDRESSIASFGVRGTSSRPALRKELQNQPLFEGYLGPMYGGTKEDGTVVIRYETQEAYNLYSS